MSAADAQQFLKELDKKLWTAADRLRANLDAAVYKHAVLGLVFLKYVSDVFKLRQDELEAQPRDPEDNGVVFADRVKSGARELATQCHWFEKVQPAIRDTSFFSQRSLLVVAK